MTHERLHWPLLLVLAGCQPSQVNLPETGSAPDVKPLASAYDPVSTAKISGRIDFKMPHNPPPHWVFDIAAIPQVRRPISNVAYEEIPNPNRPNYRNRGLQGAVVMLRGIDPARAKPWTHGSVEVELNEHGIFVIQNGQRHRDGFVCTGQAVVIRNKTDRPLGVRGRGGDFFSHILPNAGARIERRFNKPGRVALSSASGQFWASADLFVVETPYITRTGAEGEYQIDGIPAGACDFTVYLPNWNVDGREIDPETSLVVRQRYGPPFEHREQLMFKPGEHQTIDRTLNRLADQP